MRLSSKSSGGAPVTRLGPALLALTLWAIALGAAHGQTIGRAATVRNDVARVQGPRVSVINVGDDVVRNEVVRTGNESAAKLVFSDDTNLAIGPSSRVTLDTFVFAGTGSYKKAVLSLAKGAFRFTTGGSEKRAYKVVTPVATIGVRGTVFDISNSPGRTVVTLIEGEVIVCARATGKCETASVPGQTIVVTSKGIHPAGPNDPPPFNFASVCADTPDVCAPAQYAALPSTPVITVGDAGSPADWSGFYFGGFGGYAGGGSSQHDNGYVIQRLPTGQVVTRPATTTTGGGFSSPGADGSYGLGGGIGGGLAGYNFQIARFVVGVEADIGGTSSSGSSGACGGHQCGTSVTSLASVRGRLGIPIGNKILPFIAAGPAFEHISAYDALRGQSGQAWRTGYAVGGGFEYKLTPLTTIRLEYLHAGFGAAHLFDVVPNVPEQISAHSEVVQVGVIFGMGAFNPVASTIASR